MRKPVSKHSLRRAIERVQSDGLLQYDQPIGTVVDRIWHEMEKQAFNGGRKKGVSRDSVRTAEVATAELAGAEEEL